MRNDKLKVAFLDRDGVINKEVNYLYKIEEFEYTPGCIEGLKALQQRGYQFIVITNQAGIARGYYTEADYQKLTAWYVSDLKRQGIDILDVFHCPHHPQGKVPELSIECDCRKPKTGLLEQASEKYNIDLQASILVGDKVSDIEAGIAFGVNKCFLVETGHTIQLEKQIYPVVKNLEYLLNRI